MLCVAALPTRRTGPTNRLGSHKPCRHAVMRSRGPAAHTLSKGMQQPPTPVPQTHPIRSHPPALC